PANAEGNVAKLSAAITSAKMARTIDFLLVETHNPTIRLSHFVSSIPPAELGRHIGGSYLSGNLSAVVVLCCTPRSGILSPQSSVAGAHLAPCSCSAAPLDSGRFAERSQRLSRSRMPSSISTASDSGLWQTDG